MAEDERGFGDFVTRQLLRTHRPFTTTVLSPDGSQVLFRVRRPAYLVSSSMYVLDAADERIGEIHRRWHPIKRNYDLYLGHRQMAAITGNFLAWEFELRDEQGNTMALIDRNFQGFAKEIFTDAGKYVIHFGFRPQEAAQVAERTIEARSGKEVAVTPMAVTRTGVAVIPTVTGTQLVVQRPLLLDERMVALACAISIDYDFFSRHSSHGGGLFAPPLFFPGGGEAAAEGAAAGGASSAEAGAGPGVPGAGVPSAGAGGMDASETGGSGAGTAWTGDEGLGSGEVGGLGGGSGGSSSGSGSSGSGGGEDSAGWSWDSGGGGSAGDGGGDEGGGIAGVIRTIWDSLNND